MVRRRISKARFSAVRERPVSRQDGGVFDMARDEFEDAVRDALDEIPPELARVISTMGSILAGRSGRATGAGSRFGVRAGDPVCSSPVFRRLDVRGWTCPHRLAA